MHWIIDNKQWLFDGIGGAFVIAVIGWIGSALFRRSEHGGQRQRGGDKSINVQAGRDVKIGDIHKQKD
ncbi:hypothetical protein [Paraburkholderia sp. GAS41]|uniref:hypothetical protein n=1 Tax=Paraburkholderia sp. GAS41 TaxID=3035134 RepID=UPI003D205CF0